MSDKTTLFCLRHPAPLERRVIIKSCRELADDRFAFAAGETIFYPASGGQPCDTGEIRSDDGMAVASVERVSITDGIVEHVARRNCGSFAAGDGVIMSVRKADRVLHSRLHSAGELICSAVRNLGHSWLVGSASHYPGQARIVFDVVLSEMQRRHFHGELDDEIGRLLLRNDQVRVREVEDRAEAARLVGFSPDYIPHGEPVRIVFVTEGLGRPCCGTHVAETRDIGGIVIRKIRSKKNQTTVGYDITNGPCR
ncbi:alanine--tRNA ligase-related protein [Bradyrhizobium barranii]